MSPTLLEPGGGLKNPALLPRLHRGSDPAPSGPAEGKTRLFSSLAAKNLRFLTFSRFKKKKKIQWVLFADFSGTNADL